jgi:predicted lipoprotein with Yx(FWY)xxD motif
MHEISPSRSRHARWVGRGALARMAVVLGLATLLGLLGFSAAGSIARGATRTGATVSLRKTKLAMILVNSSGHSLYLFGKDRNDKSACSGSCAQFWPPLLAHGKPTAGAGVKASLLGTIKRSNGSLQVAYNKHPLYRYSLDKQAGQVNGEGSLAFGAHWYALSVKGTAVLKASTTTTATTTTSSCAYPPCP